MFRTSYRDRATVPLLAATAIAAVLLGGCSAVTSTTNTAADVARTATKGLSASSRASTDASVTEPDTPRHQQAVAFVQSQRDPLRREAATGGGEHIDALAEMLDDSQPNDLGPWMQAHYDQLFTPRLAAAALVARIAARRS